MLIDCGVKFLGFPLRLPVNKEDISEPDARAIISNLPVDVEAILITYLDSAREISQLADYLGVKYVQIHGDISELELKTLKDTNNYIVIKSLVIKENNLGQVQQTMKLCMQHVDAFITDTFDPLTGASGATGKIHDWNISRDLIAQSPKPIILAGGLNLDNVDEAIQSTQPIGVDVHTGVEKLDGSKDRNLVRSFIVKATSALNRKTINCEGSLTIGKFSRLTQKAFKGTGGCVPHLTIDLSAITFIEMPVLVYMLSILSQRVDEQLDTIIRIPKLKNVRDYLRLWNFPASVRECTGKTFSSFCIPEDIDMYFGENRTEEDHSYPASRSFCKDQFINEKCFSIVTDRLPAESDRTSKTIIVSKIANMWKNPRVKNILNNFFKHGEKGKGNGIDAQINPSDISSRIVYEAVSNAIRHPRARLLVSTSCLDATRKKGALLTLSYWDNGLAFYETILGALRSGKSVYSETHKEDCFTYHVSHHDALGDSCSFSFDSDHKITIDSKMHELFIACLSPGVSSDLSRENIIETDGDTLPSAPGWGLFALLNCACEMYGGTVAIQSGCLFANISSNSDLSAHKFKVTIREAEPGSPCFNGNMITVRLPLE